MSPLSTTEAENTMSLAIGRLFRILSRPYQPGDEAQYFACRSAVLDATESLGRLRDDKRPSYVRDRLRGAQGA